MLTSSVALVADGSLLLIGPRVMGKLRASERVFGCFSSGGSLMSGRGQGILIEVVGPRGRTSESGVVFTAGGRADVPGSSLEIASAVRLRVRVCFGGENLCCSEHGGCCGGRGGGTMSVVKISFLTRYLVAFILEGPSFTHTEPSALLASSSACHMLCRRGRSLRTCCHTTGVNEVVRGGLGMSAGVAATRGDSMLFCLVCTIMSGLLGGRRVAFRSLGGFSVRRLAPRIVGGCGRLIFTGCGRLNNGNEITGDTAFVSRVSGVLGSGSRTRSVLIAIWVTALRLFWWLLGVSGDGFWRVKVCGMYHCG